MKKMIFMGLGVAIMALTIVSCEKTAKLNPSTDSTLSKSVTSPTVCASYTADLMAGQTIKVGSVTVENDAETLFVTYTTTDGWMIECNHLYVGSLENAPVNKTGNPQLGHFPINQCFDPMVNTVTYEIPLSSLGNCFIVAAQAEVSQIVDGQIVDSQTAWGAGTPFVDKGNWATYFEYCPELCQTKLEIGDVCYEKSIAWAGSILFVDQGCWATYVEYQEGSVTLYANQTEEAGTVSFSAVTNDMVTITISLNADWILNDQVQGVKIQGYDVAPTTKPFPPSFTTYKGQDLIVTVPAYNFYAIHLDLLQVVPCE